MSIGKRVTEALQRWMAEDADGALIPASVAIDATAQKLYGKPGRGSYKQFIRDNMPLITRVAFGGSMAKEIRLRVPPKVLAKSAEIKVDGNGSCGIDEILYHLIRCGLLHEATLPNGLSVQFKSPGGFNVQDDFLEIPGSLIFGSMVAVVCCPANTGEIMQADLCLDLSGYQIPFNKLWGKKDRLWNLYEAVHAIQQD